jgi:pimeloyl-ACP methyl ester carboxylesterase
VDVDVDGLRVAAHDEGDGPVVTFLHGYPSSSLDVIPLLDRLGGVRVVAPDLPGFGASDKPADHAYFIHGAADAVEVVWRRLGVTSTTLTATGT